MHDEPVPSRPLAPPRFFLPEVARTHSGPRAPLITTAGLAGATDAGQQAVVELSAGPVTVAELLELAVVRQRALETTGRTRHLVSARVPQPVITGAKDARLIAEARRFRRSALARLGPSARPEFVWQRHEAFHDAGLRVAQKMQAPFVASVHALKVRESRSWGVRRPGWAGLVERVGERSVLWRADLIACVTDEIAEQVAKLVGRDDRVTVLPNGVDTDTFRPGPADPQLRDELGLRDRFVIGWTGSFRPFHAVDQLLAAVRRLQEVDEKVALLLVGDGVRRHVVEQSCARLRLRDVRFAGAVAFDDVPRYLRLMDVCVVPADASGVFHYSPTKLREYMACGRAVVAANRGEVGRRFAGGQGVVTVAPGQPDALADAIAGLRDDPDRRRAIGRVGRERVCRTESWHRRLEQIRGALATVPMCSDRRTTVAR